MTTPPHSLDAERSVLGAILLYTEGAITAVHVDEGLLPGDFFREQYGQVFEAMLTLHEEREPIDKLTVEAKLRGLGHAHEDAGDLAVMLDDLAGWVPVSAHVRAYARIVKEHSVRRAVLSSTYAIQRDVLIDRPLRELLEDAEQRMLTITDANVSELGQLDVDEELQRIESVRGGLDVVGVASGYKDLDKLTGGFQPAHLIVVAARPSMGKSALVTGFAEHVAMAGKAVAVFSLEMSRAEILRRLLASRARLSGEELLRGPIPPHHFERVEKAVQEVAGWPLYVDEGTDAGVIDIRSKARRLAKRVDLGLVIVDYVQLMRAEAGAESRNVEVGKITRGLKLLSKELNVPVVAVSQLSRAVEQRQDKHPQLSDLRDSGSVEQDADLVMFLYRESYYNDECAEPEVTELNIAKHRSGPLGRVKLVFMERYPKFGDYTAVEEQALRPVGSSGDEMPF